MDPDRLWSPLDAERDAIRGLSEYRTADELADAIRRLDLAIERVLRLLLREDRSASDPLRMAALSAELPVEEVVAALRRADTITMQLAAGLTQLREAAGRARRGTVTAADADLGLDVLRQLGHAVAEEAVPFAPVEDPPPTDPEPVPGRRPRRGSRSLLLAALVVVVGGAVARLALRDPGPSADVGVAAFAAGRLTDAERVFRARTEAGNGTVSDWLFLGRICRRLGRFEDAAAALRTAVDAGPQDTDVRRELGWLFMDLDRPGPAADQFRLAVEAAPEESMNWIGLIRALRAAGDPAADDWLERAPGDVRMRLDSATVIPPVRR